MPTKFEKVAYIKKEIRLLNLDLANVVEEIKNEEAKLFNSYVAVNWNAFNNGMNSWNIGFCEIAGGLLCENWELLCSGVVNNVTGLIEVSRSIESKVANGNKQKVQNLYKEAEKIKFYIEGKIVEIQALEK